MNHLDVVRCLELFDCLVVRRAFIIYLPSYVFHKCISLSESQDTAAFKQLVFMEARLPNVNMGVFTRGDMLGPKR
jgi:hypothetical protein